ncbi:MAG: single-stranded DNA-binding protein [Chlorobi bacterium]|nr:single-stranded DNA-binding protein [Chlorobiota bacterium]
MNNLRNRVNLIGNLGMDPQVRELSNGRKMAKISIATNESYRNSEGQRITDTQWHNLVAWGSTAVYAEKYLKKGQSVAVAGKLVHRAYEDKNGEKKFISEVVIDQVQILKDSAKPQEA